MVVSADGQYAFLEGTTPDTSADRSESRVGRARRHPHRRAHAPVREHAATFTESLATMLDDDGARVIVNRESPTVPSQSFVVELASKQARQLTTNVDLAPEVSKAIKRTVTARRADGFTFKVNVTLPADYKEGTRLPAMFWFYPREYDDQEAYDRSARTAERRTLPARSARAPWRSSPRRDTPWSSPTRRSSRRNGLPAERQLRGRPAQQPGRHDRRARHARASSIASGWASAATATAPSAP